MAPSRIAGSLRSARERKGWTREALAYHSGLSWAAIAQIESGRRQQVRVSSLVALASALGVSVDYLVGSDATISPQLLGHRVLTYGSEDEYLASALPFLLEGIARSEGVLCVPTRWQRDLLHSALGDDAQRVEFLDSSEWYGSLRNAAGGYLTFVRERFEGGAPGDLIILIEEEQHPELHRDGLNVAFELHISFSDAVFGLQAEVPTIDGKAKIKILTQAA